jgi:uncharacterized OB-fold protein
MVTDATATTTTRPVPIWDKDSIGYWEAARNHVLAVQRCTECGVASFPPWACCRNCNSTDLEWTPTSGKGTIFTWTTVYRSTRPEFADDVPFTLAVVELDDYPVLIPARLLGVAPLEARIDTPVEAQFEDINGEVSLLQWVVRTGEGQ